MALSGEGGYLPEDFKFLDVCASYHQLPSVLEREPAFWVERMKLKLYAERQADADRAANEEAKRKAGI